MGILGIFLDDLWVPNASPFLGSIDKENLNSEPPFIVLATLGIAESRTCLDDLWVPRGTPLKEHFGGNLKS